MSARDDGVEAEASLLDPIHEHYTQVPNALLRNHDLSTDARAILGEWLSHTRKWRLSLKTTAEENGLPYERARRAVKELRDGGYVHFIRRATGRREWEQRYAISNRPVPQCGLSGCVDCAARVNAPRKTGTRYDQDEHPVSPGGNGSTKSGTRSDQGEHPVSPGGNGHMNSGVHIEDHVEDQEDSALRAGVLPPADEDGALFPGPPPPPPPVPTPEQGITRRAQVLTAEYRALVPLSSHLAVRGIVKTAIKAGEWTDDQIREALAKIAEQRRTVTANSLRYQLEQITNGGEAREVAYDRW